MLDDRQGFFVEPTIISLPLPLPLPALDTIAMTGGHSPSPSPGPSPCPSISEEERFVPILYVMKVNSFEEALRVNNSVSQGLSSSLFTQVDGGGSRTHLVLHTILITVNISYHSYLINQHALSAHPTNPPHPPTVSITSFIPSFLTPPRDFVKCFHCSLSSPLVLKLLKLPTLPTTLFHPMVHPKICVRCFHCSLSSPLVLTYSPPPNHLVYPMVYPRICVRCFHCSLSSPLVFTLPTTLFHPIIFHLTLGSA